MPISSLHRIAIGLAIGPWLGCVSASVGDEGNGGASAAETGAASAGNTADAGAGPSGLECGEDPTYGVRLCRGVETCGALRVQGEELESCGFRKGEDAFSLDCLCADALCPIGVPATCEEAALMLQDATRYTVCAQVADGTCEALSPAKKQVTPGNCDAACLSSCGASQACRDLCGC